MKQGFGISSLPTKIAKPKKSCTPLQQSASFFVLPGDLGLEAEIQKSLFYSRFLIVCLRKSLFYLKFLIVFESQLAWPAVARPTDQSKNLVLLKVFKDFFCEKNLFYLRFLKVFEGWLARPAAVEARRPVQKSCFT